MKKIFAIIFVILMGFQFPSCQATKTEAVSLRKLAYAMPEEVYKITLKDGKAGMMSDVRVYPENNTIRGYMIKKDRYVSISLSKIEKIEKILK